MFGGYLKRGAGRTGRNMRSTSRISRLNFEHRDGIPVLSLAEMDIWDGTDLSLLRDTLWDMIKKEGCKSFGIDLRQVQYIPSGFFGTMYSWHSRGVKVRLYSPHTRIRSMLWFRHCFQPIEDNCYLLSNTLRLDFDERPELKWYELPFCANDEGRESLRALAMTE